MLPLYPPFDPSPKRKVPPLGNPLTHDPPPLLFPSPLCRVSELSAKLEELQSTATAQHAQQVSLQGTVSKLQSELRVATTSLANEEGETAALRVQLQEASTGRLRAATSLQAAEDELVRLRAEASALATQLNDEQVLKKGGVGTPVASRLRRNYVASDLLFDTNGEY